MEFRIEREVFANALGKMQGIAEKRTTQAILSHVLMETREGSLRLAATDLDVTLQGSYAAEIEAEGAVCAAASHLHEIVRALPVGMLSIKTAENHYLEIRSGSVEYHIVGAAAEQFPSLPDADVSEAVELTRALLVGMVDAIHFSISTDETRPNLNGALVKAIGPSKLMMVSTDGHRLSKVVRDVDADLSMLPEDGIIVPRKGLGELRRTFDERTERISFGLQGSSAVFRSDDEVLFVRLIDGAFPDFDKVIQKESGVIGVVERMQFIDAVHRVSLVSGGPTKGVRIVLTPERIRLLAHNPDVGEAHEDVTLEFDKLELPPDRESVEIGYNSKYLREALLALTSDEITYETNDASAPTILRNRGEEESFYVVMPMRF